MIDIKLSDYLKHNLKEVISLALFAPSVHNTQPWKVRLKDKKLIVAIDPERQLTYGDPTGRQTVISLGIFAEAIAISATAFSLEAGIRFLSPDKAEIGFKRTAKLSDSNLLGALKTRHTDRSVYTPAEVAASHIKLIEAAGSKQASVKVSVDAGIIDQTARLTKKGISLALSSPDFRSELAEYVLPKGSRRRTGISAESLRLNPLQEFAKPLFLKWGLGVSLDVRMELKRWQSASGLVFITTPGDMPPDWFEAGRAYLRACLELERQGFSQATSAAVVEAADFHEDIEIAAGLDGRLQALVRFGKGSRKKAYSPRLPAEDLIEPISKP